MYAKVRRQRTGERMKFASRKWDYATAPLSSLIHFSVFCLPQDVPSTTGLLSPGFSLPLASPKRLHPLKKLNQK
ncbi:hypothetical protein L2E82_28761 [Cichorium intybus]|uniref:Uncharacterized protein n=1 Tax=Cichorium intybus TaxID=13427 RepID=A0ACB9CWJ2_CICIN|nr:hypothetical protein L2E82_28761 [Cichorium intybus]